MNLVYHNELNDLMHYNESTDVSDEKLIHEKNKKTISICIKGKEYRYVANPGENIERIFRSLKGIMKHSEAGYRALNYLKKHAVCYYGCNNPKLGLSILNND